MIFANSFFRTATRHNQLSYQRCFEQKQTTSHSNPVSTVPKKDSILLPYLGLQSNQVAKRLKSCVYKFYSCVNLKIVFQSTRCINSFFPYKGHINRSQQSRVIYRANCWDCNGFYIGKTKRRLYDRKHIPSILRPSLKVTILQPLLTTSRLLDITSSGTNLIF